MHGSLPSSYMSTASSPRVTIGIPFFNDELTLAEALRAVFRQSYQNWELVLIDDGSTDRSLAIARAVTDPRVRIVSDGVNRGLIARLNQLVGAARGEFLARMDADDLMHRDRIRMQVEYLDANPSIHLTDCGGCAFLSKDSIIGGTKLGPIDLSRDAPLRRGLLLHAAVLSRVSWSRNNLYSSSYVRAEDMELWCRSQDSSQFGRVCSPLYFIRERRSSVRGYLASYQKTVHSVRKIQRQYGPDRIGRLRTTALLAFTHFKGLSYKVASALGCQDRLLATRYEPLSLEQVRDSRFEIAAIQSSPVPGLDCVGEPL